MARVKYHPSLFIDQDDTTCYAKDLKEKSKHCSKSGIINRHEIFYGRSYRDKSKKYGLWVCLCYECHEKVHFGKDHSLDIKLKQEGQKRFEEVHSHELFMYEFDKNRL